MARRAGTFTTAIRIDSGDIVVQCGLHQRLANVGTHFMFRTIVFNENDSGNGNTLVQNRLNGLQTLDLERELS